MTRPDVFERMVAHAIPERWKDDDHILPMAIVVTLLRRYHARMVRLVNRQGRMTQFNEFAGDWIDRKEFLADLLKMKKGRR